MSDCANAGRSVPEPPLRLRVEFADGTAWDYPLARNGREVERVIVDGVECAPSGMQRAALEHWAGEVTRAERERDACRERIGELEAGNRRLRASLESLRGNVEADMPAIALDWDNAPDKRRREWCQHLYEHASAQDARIAELEEIARDMWLTWKLLDERGEGPNRFHNGWKTFNDRMAELGIEVEA